MKGLYFHCIVFPDATYYISIPTIYPFSQEAIDLQQEIYHIFEADLRSELEALIDTYKDDYEFSIDRPEENIMNFPRDGSEYYIGYLAGYRNGVLSITIRRNLPDAGNHAFEVYNFDIATGKQIGTLESLELIGFGLEQAVHKVEDLYQWTQKSNTPPDDYQRLLKKTLSEENFTNSNLIIYDDSYLSIIIDIFTIHRTEPLRWSIGLGFLPS